MKLRSLISHKHKLHVLPAAEAVKDVVPTRRELLQGRFQQGPNFGGLFLLERWIDDRLFEPDADGDSELAALEAAHKAGYTLSEMRDAWQKHYTSYISDEDWDALRDSGITAVRIPIGFWIINDGAFTANTPFEKFTEVYAGAWQALRDLISAADQRDIGVIVDLHALPGGANGDAHSGTNSGKSEFWLHQCHRNMMQGAIEWVTRALLRYENIVGLEIINEPSYGEPKLREYYLETLERIRRISLDLPVIIGDGWDLPWCCKIVKELNDQVSKDGVPRTVGLIIDTHVYRAFSEEDKSTPADELVSRSRSSLPQNRDVDIMVGEYSCVLSEESWSAFSGDRKLTELRYGQEQLSGFTQSARAGAMFWTYKFGNGCGGAWDFNAMSACGAIPRWQAGESYSHSPPSLDDALRHAMDAHIQFWKSKDRSENWENWRFEEGFVQGYTDGESFASFHQSILGRLAAWTAARTAQHIQRSGPSSKIWVYSHGYAQGVRAYAG